MTAVGASRSSKGIFASFPSGAFVTLNTNPASLEGNQRSAEVNEQPRGSLVLSKWGRCFIKWGGICGISVIRDCNTMKE